MSRETKDVVKEPTRRAPWSRRGKPKWDRQPTQSSAVLIATVGIPIPPTVLRRAMELGGGRPVAVISIARIYGSAFGLPNPGLMPTRKEMDEQLDVVAKAIDRLEKSGVEAWGQVATTRRYAKTIAQAAQARGVERVLVVTPPVPRWRSMVEGDLAKDVTRRIRRIDQEIAVEGITV